MNIDPAREYSPKEAAEFIGRSVMTIRRAIRRGYLKARNDGTCTQEYFMIKGKDLIAYNKRRSQEEI